MLSLLKCLSQSPSESYSKQKRAQRGFHAKLPSELSRAAVNAPDHAISAQLGPQLLTLSRPSPAMALLKFYNITNIICYITYSIINLVLHTLPHKQRLTHNQNCSNCAKHSSHTNLQALATDSLALQPMAVAACGKRFEQAWHMPVGS